MKKKVLKSVYWTSIKIQLFFHVSPSKHSPFFYLPFSFVYGFYFLRHNTPFRTFLVNNMYSYPAEYLLHPVPVMAVYGLPTPDEPSLLDALDEQPQKNESSKMGLATNLLSLFTNKSEYTLYEATTYLSNQQVPPPFRVIPVSKVKIVIISIDNL